MSVQDFDIQRDLEALRDKLVAAITADNARLKMNTALLRKVESSLLEYQRPNEFATKRPPGRPRWSGRENTGSVRFTLDAIESLPNNRFTATDVLEAVNRLYPESKITRGQMSSLLWKLLSRNGVTTFRQVTPWTGGRAPAIYEKAHQDLNPSNVSKFHFMAQGSHKMHTNVKEKKA